MSNTRKRYVLKLIGRILLLFIAIGLYFIVPSQFQVLEGNTFFETFTFFHYLWLIWMIDIIYQIIPLKNKFPIGSQKFFLNRYQESSQPINQEALRKYTRFANKGAFIVLGVWTIFNLGIGVLHLKGIIDQKIMLLISIFFYVCDLICVLVWCPFRLMMKNRCCTTCRIFNWDHMMMFTPLIFVGGFFSWSLVMMSLLACLVWEYCVYKYPERFWEVSNIALRCSACSDKLCTQYCKRRK